MRAWVLLLALCLLPTASAATARVTLAPATGTATSGALVPVEVRVEAEGFWCSQPREVVVEATAWGYGAQARLRNATLRFPMSDDPRFGEPFIANATMEVHVLAMGQETGTVEIMASVSPPADCFAPDGWTTLAGNTTLRVVPEAPAEPAPPPEDPAADTRETAGDAEPPAANETNASRQEDAQESVHDERRPPGSGYIGDYRPPAGGNDAPGPALLVVLLAVAVVALSRKR